MKTRIALMLAGLTVLTFSATRAFAVEGALGRPISGMSIAPFAGVIPPEPGFLVSVAETYYDGSFAAVSLHRLALFCVQSFADRRKATVVRST